MTNIIIPKPYFYLFMRRIRYIVRRHIISKNGYKYHSSTRLQVKNPIKNTGLIPDLF